MFSIAEGIDGPAAFLGSEAPDLGMKIQILSVSQSQSQPQTQTQTQIQSQPQSQLQSPAPEEPERDGDTETLLEPKTDIHELLQKQGESKKSLILKELLVLLLIFVYFVRECLQNQSNTL